MNLRQGENLSPLLFSLYVNDLETFLINRNVETIDLHMGNDAVEPWLRFLILLYADDTVLFANSAEGLQHCIDTVIEYCNQWKLVINRGKTKAMVFGFRRQVNPPIFQLDGQPIETVNEFKYLGITFNFNGSFVKCRSNLCDQARKAMCYVLNRIQEQSLDIDVAFELFDAMVLPILTFGSEIWGFENLDQIERLHLKFCKYVLKLKRSTVTAMVYGELGRFPVSVAIRVKMISFWGRLLRQNGTIANRMYHLVYDRYMNGKQSKWLKCIKETLENCGLAGVWISHQFRNPKHLATIVKRTLKDQYIQNWQAGLQNTTKTAIYKEIKQSWGFENYLLQLPESQRITLCKFRCGNHKLPIETGRYNNTPRNDRLCLKCNNGSVCDEVHFVLSCPHFSNLRNRHIPNRFTMHPDIQKYKELFNSPINILKKLSIYLRKALTEFR